MRILGLAILAGTLAACAPSVPDSGRGVGFGAIGGATVPAPPVEPGQPAGLVAPGRISDEALPPGVDLPQSGQPGQGGEALQSGADPASAGSAGPEAPRPVVNLDNPGISDEQDFSAVTARETIESDRARIEAQREAYQVIAPTALPVRPDRTFASIVEFALATTNEVGQPLYSRSRILAQRRFERNCAKYASSDLAQEAFLKAGGPRRDRYGLDPDGDGFACYWDPKPFRLAVKAQGQ